MDTNSNNSGAVGWFGVAGFASQLRNFKKIMGVAARAGSP